MNVGSLFSGIGGFDLGLQRAGLEIAFHSEIDGRASQVLDRHWPEVENLGDITKAERFADVDVLCGGFPCQNLSVAGNRQGLAGAESRLWFEFHRVIAQTTPRWVLIENVPGLLSSNQGEDMAIIVRGLEELGYGWAYRVLDSRYFGVPQRRRRVFIVGHLGGHGGCEVLFEPESLPGHPAKGREAGQAAPTTTGNGAGTSGGGQLVANSVKGNPNRGADTYVVFAQNQRDEVRELGNQAGALAAEPGMKQQTYLLRNREGKPGGGKVGNLPRGMFTSERGDWQTPPDFLSELHGEFGFTFDPCPPVGPEFELRVDGLTTSWQGHRVFCNPPYGREIGKWVKKAWDESRAGALVVLLVPARTDTAWWHDYCMKGEVRFLRGRLRFWKDGKEGDPAPFPSAVVIFRPPFSFQMNQRNEMVDLKGQAACVMAQQGPLDTVLMDGIAPDAPRRLTPTECERLQGFPDGWTEGHPDSARYRMLGNAVTVNVAEWIGKRIANQGAHR